MVKYNEHKGLNQRLPGYQVKLGFGLHMGQAIEGAIGSYYKIDASYLSPNVKFAERLEGATKTYGVPILISGSLYRHFTKETKSHCRQVDWVRMAGFDEPIKLYTVDLDPEGLPLSEKEPYKTLKDRKIKRVLNRIQRENFAKSAFSGSFKTSSLFETHQDLVHMRKPFSEYFLLKYEEAFMQLIEGKWDVAREKFQAIIDHLWPEDPLSLYHLNYIGDRDEAPDGWNGYKFLAD